MNAAIGAGSNLYGRRRILRPLSEDAMFDLVLLAAAVGFFALCAGYVSACNRL